MITRFLSKWIIRLLVLGVAGATGLLALGFFGWLHPAFDTLAHGRAHISVCLLLAGLWLMFSRWRKVGYVGFAAGAIGIASSTMLFPLSSQVQDRVPGKPVYSLFHLNLLWNHDDPAMVVEEIMRMDPEILSVSEASYIWDPHLEKLDAHWPHLFNCPEEGPRGGVRIYSKWPMDRQSAYCGEYGSFGKIAVRAPGLDALELVSLHFRWPWPASGPRQLRAALPVIKSLGPDVLVAGDFNATPWSDAVQTFANAGGLEIMRGIGPTWLFTEFGQNLTGWVGFPIDNIAYKGRVRLLSAKALPSVGSDHLPILVKFQID